MISDQDIKDANLSSEDIIKIVMETTGSDRVEAQFILDIEAGKIDGDVISVSDEDIRNELKPIVDKAPVDDQGLGQYLKDLLDDKIITIEDVTFLLDNEDMFTQ